MEETENPENPAKLEILIGYKLSMVRSMALLAMLALATTNGKNKIEKPAKGFQGESTC